MKRQELIDYLYDNVNPTELTIEECADDIIDLFDNDKYRWHDLRKNPNDLPENKIKEYNCEWSETVFIYGKNKYGYDYCLADYAYCIDGNYSNKRWCEACDTEGFGFDEVIAWREIEPFKKEVENNEWEEKSE